MQYRMFEIAGYFVQRFQHKFPLVQEWMRNRQILFVENQIVVKQNIDVDKSVVILGIFRFHRASQLFFDVLRQKKTGACIQIGFCDEAGVQKGILRGKPPGFTIMKRRSGHYRSNRLLYSLNGSLQRFFTLSEICAQTKIEPSHNYQIINIASP